MATNYSLISCNNLLYPDKTGFCWASTHPMEGLVVYEDVAPVNTSKTYTLVLVGVNTLRCANWLPKLEVTTQNSCVSSYGIFKYENCETGEFINFGFPFGDPINSVLRKDGDSECWEFAGEEALANELIINFSEYSSCNECLEARAEDICVFGERTLSYAVKARQPIQPPIDRGFDRCCYTQVALADLSDNDPYKNDFTGTYFKKQTPNDTVVFKLKDMSTMVEVTLNDDTYGRFQDFGGVQSDLSFYIVDWRKVLTVLGTATYQIKQEIGTAGLPPTDIFGNSIELRNFSINEADLYVRIDSLMDGFLVKDNVNFKDTGYETSLRFKGFFGNNNPSFEEERLFKNNYDSLQITMSKENEYIFYASSLPECIANQIFDFMLYGNTIKISDYNKNNHSYLYELTPVTLISNDGNQYVNTSRGVTLNLRFTDKIQNNRKTNC